MSWVEALLFGLLQGLTEFLPISSSAHLTLAQWFLHREGSEVILFDLVCHLGTLFALLYFLRKEIVRTWEEGRERLPLFFVALLPLIPAYFLLKPLRDFASQPSCLGFCLILTSLILFASQNWRLYLAPPSTRKEQLRSSLWIGAMQSMALIPGISRSASTIGCARILGWEMKEAVRFSFLLSIPTIIGGNCLELLKIALSSAPSPSISTSTCAIGFLSSFLCGSIVIRPALSFLEKGNLKPFAWYCLILGLLVSIYLNLW